MSEWIKISERLPICNEKILVYKDGEVGIFNPAIFPNPLNILTSNLTHWMPLPEPPEIEEEVK